MWSKFMPYTPQTIVGTATMAAQAVIFRMSSFCATVTRARCAWRMELRSSSNAAICSVARSR